MKKRNLFRTLWTILVLPPLLAMLLLLSPAALADGVDAGTDAIQISPEGAVSLVSGHIAAEGVSSVQFQLRTEGEVSFSFAGDIAGAYLTNCVAGDGTLDVYISGTAPLIAQGYTSRLLGTVSPADKAQPVQSSLQYVYGVSMSAMNTDLSGESGDALARLQSVLESATAQFGSTHMYSDESWDRLNAAISAIEQLLESGSVTEEPSAWWSQATRTWARRWPLPGPWTPPGIRRPATRPCRPRSRRRRPSRPRAAAPRRRMSPMPCRPCVTP